MDAERLVETGRDPILKEAKERVDRRQSRIPRTRGVAALVFYVLKEGEDHGRVDLFDLEPGRPAAEAAGHKSHEKLKAGGVSLAGVRARFALAR